jgi:hypothetical protein
MRGSIDHLRVRVIIAVGEGEVVVQSGIVAASVGLVIEAIARSVARLPTGS